MINVVNKVSGKGRTYADITSVTPVMTGMEAQVPQPSQFNIPSGASAPAPQVTTQVTVEQPQAVAPAPVAQPAPAQPAQAQMFSAPSAPAPF